MRTSADKGPRSSPLEKTVSILRCLVESRRRRGVQELADDLGLNVSTTHRLLRGLVAEGLVGYDPSTRLYGVGAEFLRLAAIARESVPLEEVGRPVMRELVNECAETVCLAAYEPAHKAITPLAVEECDHPLRYTIEIGALWPLHAGASGKAILAYLAEAEIEGVIGEGDLEALTDRTVTDPEQLAEDLEVVQRQGYAFSRGERIAEAVGIAAPLFNAANKVAGCLAITIPSHRFVPGSELRLGPLVAEYAGRISELLGSPTPSRSTEAVSGGER